MKKIALLLSLAFLAVKPAEAGTLADWGNFLLEDIKDIRCQHNYDVFVPFLIFTTLPVLAAATTKSV